MHYYTHHIGDYRKDTGHLTLLEHGIYRQMLDLYYLDESPLPKDKSQCMRLVCVRSADEIQAFENVLADFFKLTERGYEHERCKKELGRIYDKSDKAREAAKKRWANNDADAMQTHSGRNASDDATGYATSDATQLPINPIPINPKKERAKRFCPPSLEEVAAYCYERQNQVNPQRFIDHYESNGWMVGKNKMKSWKASVRTWESRGNGNGNNQGQSTSRAKRFSDELDELARRDIEQNGFTDKLG